ncbi:Hypothetical membrane protein (DedA family) [Propionibacterium freudenreichii]|nr:Hypothetical membrane protein (DedA family) [Propionibacterium freudenreichii]SCQ70796.1 Hypothetical membrane protein (DedA family) [Propionibacterium freudenreichii]SCQ79588.1 Hypothetical membrane protein (DedA family) [Propionibacterium freudenreichii]
MVSDEQRDRAADTPQASGPAGNAGATGPLPARVGAPQSEAAEAQGAPVTAMAPGQPHGPDQPNGSGQPHVADQSATSDEPEWWQDDSMPWKHKPGRSDIACLAWLGGLGVFSMLMLPLRAWLMGSPDRIPLLVALTGSRTGTAMLGAVVRTGDYAVSWDLGGHLIAISWVWPMIAAVIMSCKFDWIYWWAGKLWGRGMIEVWAGKSERARRRYERLEKWAGKVGWLAFVLAYLPVPLPLMAVVFVLAGASGMRLRRFVVLDVVVCSCWTVVFGVLGYVVGTPITDVLNVYSKVANYVTIGLVVLVVAWSIIGSARKARTALHEHA